MIGGRACDTLTIGMTPVTFIRMLISEEHTKRLRIIVHCSVCEFDKPTSV